MKWVPDVRGMFSVHVRSLTAQSRLFRLRIMLAVCPICLCVVTVRTPLLYPPPPAGSPLWPCSSNQTDQPTVCKRRGGTVRESARRACCHYRGLHDRLLTAPIIHELFTHCWYNVEPTSQMAAQHYATICSTSLVRWKSASVISSKSVISGY